MPDVKSYECDGPRCEVVGKAVKQHAYRPARPDRWIEMDLTQTDGTRTAKVAFCSTACFQAFAFETTWDPDIGFSFYGAAIEVPDPADFGPTPARGPHSHQIRYGFERKMGQCSDSCCAWRFRYVRDLQFAVRSWPPNATVDLFCHVDVLEVLAAL